ncbi:MAG: hypothetical protein IID51_09665 [Proteobacteria bacterium]|nr:hypothetical protein [Pseudomonadota bacterium]
MVVKIKPFLKKLLGRLPVIRRFAGDEKGVTLVYVAISLPVILGFAGIGVDIAVWNLDKRESQSMADAAAMAAGVSVMRSGNFATIDATALAGAIDNGFSAANGDTIIINNPPSIGPRSAAVWGDPDGDGISGDTDAIEVFIRRPAPALFSSIIMNNTNQFVRSRTVVNAINDPGDSCFMSLDPEGGITVSGGATVSLDCGALANGDLTLNGSACLGTSGTSVVGDITYNPDPCITEPGPAITRPDPLRFLPEVEERVCDINAAMNVTSSAPPKELYPRSNGVLVICNVGIRIQPSGTLILHPGIYVFHKGASLDVFGILDASAGVMIYFTEDAGQSNPGPLTLQAGGSMTVNPLSPGDLDAGTTQCNSGSNNTPPGPTLGVCGGTVNLSDNGATPWDELDEIYEGIAFFQDRDAKAANGDSSVTYNFTGDSSMLIDGVIYLPGGDVQWSGGSSSSANAILSDSITVTGNADFGTIEGTILETLLAFVFIKIIE